MNSKFILIAAIIALVGACPRSFAQFCDDDGEYLGRLGAKPFLADSTSNKFGPFGNPYASDSIENLYGRYGSPYSPISPCNPYAAKPLF